MSRLPHIPSELFFDIIPSLPIKTLARFRCLSKFWNNFISESYVFSKHVSYSENLKIMLRISNLFHILGFESSGKVGITIAMSREDQSSLVVLGSCNGLLCITYELGNLKKVCYLWNPWTGEFFELPNYKFSMALGVGYKPSVNDYIVLSIERHTTINCRGFSRVSGFSLATNLWRWIIDIPYRVQPKPGVLVSGALHWLAVSSWTSSDTFNLVIAFNIARETVHEVPLPNFKYYNEFNMDVAELAGELCFVCYYKTSVEAWLMKDYGVKESWTRLFNIKEFIGGVYIKELIPLCFTKDGALLLRLDYRYLVVYDPNIVGLWFSHIPGIWLSDNFDTITCYTQSAVRLKP
ncbi:hypothetical protein IFM89_023752 [Coptis chinensis]|uniref:F-box domain-containing protein n=1 Tax=Coptis chinensis TaxID=261450 RepID=A0A835LF06_9MAGN|nr:hypothetical protein IFM89_023752 [Coptis chinensis]